MAWYYLLLIVLAVFILPGVIGGFLSRRFKMPDHGWRIGLVLFALFAGLATVFTGTPQMGIDLRGGVILIYEVQPSADAEDQSIDMEKLATVISKRLNPGGVMEIEIRPYGPNQIRIIVPDADEEEVKRIQKNISAAGTLEFRIVANRTDHSSLIDLAETSTAREVRSGERVRARWVPVEPRFEEQYVGRGNEFGVRRAPANDQRLEVLVVVDRHNVTGDYLRRVSAGINNTGRPSAKFTFNARGAVLFRRLTSENVPDPITRFQRHLGIILDSYLHNAPVLEGVISDRGEISGDFSSEELDDLVTVLRAGSLPATLSEEPISSQMIDPTLGADTVQKGQVAMLISIGAVMLFILVYYRFAGVVACLALLTNLVLILGVMMTINAAFTLPGLAGLVLTIGMAVDANVLIFERIREELDRGAALRMAIRNGFARATTTVVDANLTTLITATVLYVIGTDQVRGFAVVLWLGIVMSMFTAIFASRVVFDIAERRRWITRLKMMRMLGRTRIDFVGMRRLAAVVSVVVIAIGLAGVGSRGKNLLNIDFTGGTSIELQFNEPQDVAYVRAALTDQLADVTVSRKYERGDDKRGERYEINTSNQDINGVRLILTDIFADKLARNEMQIEQLAMITPDDQPSESPGQSGPSFPDGDPPADDDSSAGDGEADTQAPSPDDQSGLLSRPTAQVVLVNYRQDEPPPAPEENSAAGEEAAQPAGPDPAETDVAESDEPAEPSQDPFAAGTRAALTFTVPLDEETVRDHIEEQLEVAGHAAARLEVEPLEEPADGGKRALRWQVVLDLSPEEARTVLSQMEAQLAKTPFFASAVKVGGKVATNTQQQAIYALLASLLFIVAYIWIRFQKVAFGLAAVVALVHDVLLTLGALAVSVFVAPYLGFLLIDPFKIDLPIVAAFLTIIGYSLNDTIVVFDRIREVKGKSPDITDEMVNTSINQTLSRTVLTSLTTLIAVMILYIGGGQGIHGFAFALLVGVLAGTYSSIFVASPILLWLMRPRGAGGAGQKKPPRQQVVEPSGIGS